MAAPPLSYFRKYSRVIFGRLRSRVETSRLLACWIVSASFFSSEDDCAHRKETSIRNGRLRMVRRMSRIDSGMKDYANDLINLQELQIDRGADVQDLSCGTQAPCLLVNAEDDDVVRFFILGKQVIAGGINLKTARNLTLRGNVFDLGQGAFLGIDGECRNAVVPAI